MFGFFFFFPDFMDGMKDFLHCSKSNNLSPGIDKKHKNSNSRRYACADCGQIFSISASLIRHRIYECGIPPPDEDEEGEEEEVEEIEISLSPDKIGRPTKGKRKHVCEKCHKSYTFFTSLWRHQHYECEVERRFSCNLCDAKFAQKGNLDRHVRAKHSAWIGCFTV